ncbi:MAG: hypothetical protein K2P70_01800 [Hyphomonadaceae bacterium]|nr:hypothetical protein [Hyphomonadaceae bacterium]
MLDVLSGVVSDALLGVGFPQGLRGRQLYSVADFSGAHSNVGYDTYAFLVFDLDRNEWWLTAQRAFRSEALKSRRRMSFKNLGDRARRRALKPFLMAAEEIEGALIVFAIKKDHGSMFITSPSAREDDALKMWKPTVREHLMRVLHLGALVIARVSAPGQDLMWITDQDEIASNDAQLTEMTTLFANIWGNITDHSLGHLRCGTTRSDDGSLVLEDLCAIPDLAAGASCELLSVMAREQLFPVKGLVTPLRPSGFSPKTIVISNWLADRTRPLKRIIVVLDADGTNDAGRVTHLRLEPIPSL